MSEPQHVNAAQPVGTTNEIGRIEWVQKVLQQLPANSRILDAGAGEQQFKKFCSHLNYVSQDFAQYKPEEVKTGFQMPSWDYGKLDIVSDIASIPEPDRSFDAVLCTEVFEHIINPREAVHEFSRLLKKDGYLIVTAPFCSLTHFAPYHFYTGFSQYFYEKVLVDEGFSIKQIIPNGNYFEYLGQEMRRLNSMSRKYSDAPGPSFIERKAIQYILKLLARLSPKDKGSAEVLCYGYHVLAKKL